MKQYISKSPSQTFNLGLKLGANLPEGTVLSFFGDLGAGKTTFIKGIVSGAAKLNPEDIKSPTFNYLHIYEGQKKIYHFDLYRLAKEEDFLTLGLDEYLEAEGICCVEWPERIPLSLPVSALSIHIHISGQTERIFSIDDRLGFKE